VTKIYRGCHRNSMMPSHFSRGSEGLKMVEENQDGSHTLTSQGQNWPERISGRQLFENHKTK
uniref:Uncharacterized protein n=1 Tax=Chrysemys picta bellii TaxID=8478 RepID=A0A8C3I0A3_CHRPI